MTAIQKSPTTEELHRLLQSDPELRALVNISDRLARDVSTLTNTIQNLAEEAQMVQAAIARMVLEKAKEAEAGKPASGTS